MMAEGMTVLDLDRLLRQVAIQRRHCDCWAELQRDTMVTVEDQGLDSLKIVANGHSVHR